MSDGYDREDEQADWSDRVSGHPYVCRACGGDVHFAARIGPDGRGSQENKGVQLACGCHSYNGDGMPGLDDFPAKWVVSFDTEVLAADE